MVKELTPEEIVRIIDPDNTFLAECEDAVKWRKNLKNEKRI